MKNTKVTKPYPNLNSSLQLKKNFKQFQFYKNPKIQLNKNKPSLD